MCEGDAEGNGGVSGPGPLESVLELCVVRPRESESGYAESGMGLCSSISMPIYASLFFRPSLAASLSAVERRDDVGEGMRLDGAVGGEAAYGESV